MYPPVSGSCSDITWLRPWPGRKSLRCWLGSFPSLRSVAAVTMTALLTGRSRAPAPPRFTPSLADLRGGGAGPGVARSQERGDARRFLRHSHVVILSAELPRPFPSSWFSQVPRETTDGTDTLKVICFKEWALHPWGLGRPTICCLQAEVQESWCCNSVCV